LATASREAAADDSDWTSLLADSLAWREREIPAVRDAKLEAAMESRSAARQAARCAA
jgi:hypothetical protein